MNRVGIIVTMIILTDSEKAKAASEIRNLITSSGQTAVLRRKQVGEVLYGTDEAAFVDAGAFPLEFSDTPSADIAQKADALACVLAEMDVNVEDRVRFGGVEYRVQTVAPQSLFGVTTHKVLELVRLRGA